MSTIHPLAKKNIARARSVLFLFCTHAGEQKNIKDKSSKNGGLWRLVISIFSYNDVKSKPTHHVGGANKHILMFKCGLPVTSDEDAIIFWAQKCIFFYKKTCFRKF
jgi:hypothetical protein